MSYQLDKYENFFANVAFSRHTLLHFASFTVEAVAAAAVDAAIVARAAPLRGLRDAFQQELVARLGADGLSRSGTAAEAAAFTAFKGFIVETNVVLIGPYLLRNPSQTGRIYPDKLRGLTQASKRNRLARLTAYTQVLETTPDLPLLPLAPDAPAGTPAQMPGATARALLTAYEAALMQKTIGRTTLKSEIIDLTPGAQTLIKALWGVHCAALNHHWEEPEQARKYFDYAALPHRVRKRRTTQSPAAGE